MANKNTVSRVMADRKTRRVVATEVADRIEELAKLRAQANEIADVTKDIQAQVLAGLEAAHVKSTTITGRDGRRYTATVVKGEQLIIDENSLKSRVGAKVWRQITSLVLDRKKLEEVIARDPTVATAVAASSHNAPKTPFVKTTIKK